MNSVERLLAEHNLIERALSLLETAVARIETGQPISAEFPLWSVRFFQEFADGCHHATEEDVFFPTLKERGVQESSLKKNLATITRSHRSTAFVDQTPVC